jgi:GntR family transcriptional regulator/MocR family aminotransferase
MLTYPMEQRGELSLYEYLYRCIKRDIEEGAIPADSKLPSKRTFAAHLGVSLITVENAYAQLLAEGYLYTKPRRGYYAMPLPAYRTPSEPAASPQPAATFPPLPLEDPAPDSSMLFDFSRTTTGTDPAIQNLWAKALRETLTEEAGLHPASLPAAGLPRLRNAIARHLGSFRGMNVDPACIVIGSGAQTLYNLMVQLLGRQRTYAIENPGYPKLASIYQSAGAAIAPIPLDEQGMQIAPLQQSAASVAHIMPTHQFPTGIVTSIARRYELLAWAAQDPQRYLIEDDYDCEFRLAGRPIPALQSIDRSDKVIYTNTFSRSLGADMRVAYAILPRPLMRRFRQQLGFYSNTVNAIIQNALAHLIETGAFERHINRVRTTHRLQRDALLASRRTRQCRPALNPSYRLTPHRRAAGLRSAAARHYLGSFVAVPPIDSIDGT